MMNSFRYRFYCRISYIFDRISRILAEIPSIVDGQIFMYHHVTNDFLDISESCKCRVDRFEEIILQFKKEGYRFVSVDRLLEILKNRLPERFIVITFDDANEDMFLNAYPILKLLKIPFIVYVTIDFINKEGFINDEQLEILNNEPLCTIGSHTISHPMLRYSKNAFNEISQSKQILEQKLGKPVLHFAYPYGKFSAVSIKNMRMVKKAGYKSAMGTIESKLTTCFRKCIWYLPRVVIK